MFKLTMKIQLCLVVFLLFCSVQSRTIRKISDAVLLSQTNSIVFTNLSETQCLCKTSSNISAVNYFIDGTCQLFALPVCDYDVRIDIHCQLFLFDSSLNPFRPGCSINATELMQRLNRSVVITTISIGARSLIMDDRGYLVALSYPFSYLERYDPMTLTRIDRINITNSTAASLAYFNGAYFIGLLSNNIMVMNSTTLTVINTISSSFLQGPRDMIFLNDGQTMVVASSSNDFLVFFNRSTPGSTLYSYSYRIPFSNRSPYGLWRVNDTFFYVTSYTNSTILSYSAVNSSFWSETLVIDARPMVSTSLAYGADVAIDPCGRFWFTLNVAGVLIYDRDGSYLAQLSGQYYSIFGIVITKNFTIYLSASVSSQIFRLQPDLNC